MNVWKFAVLMIPGVLVGCQSTCKTPTPSYVSYPPPGAVVLPSQPGFNPPAVAQPSVPDRIAPVANPLSVPSAIQPYAAPAPAPDPTKQKTSGFETKPKSERPDLMTRRF